MPSKRLKVNHSEGVNNTGVDPAWLRAQIVRQQMRVNNALALVTATEQYQDYQKKQGVLDYLQAELEAASAVDDPPDPPDPPDPEDPPEDPEGSSEEET